MNNSYIAITGLQKAEVLNEEIAETAGCQQALLKCRCSLISTGTELSRYCATKKGFTYPVRPGYSAVGTIIAKGEGLDDFAIGQRVFYSGAHQQYCLLTQQNRKQGSHIFALPSALSDTEAALANLGMIAMSGVNACTVKLGDKAVVFGLGTIGLLTALLLQLNGAAVLGLDPVVHRCALGEQMGLKHVSSQADQAAAVAEFTGCKGADIVVDATGLAAVIATAVAAAGRYSQLILLGSPRAACTGDLTALLSGIHMKNITVTGAFNNLETVAPAEGSRLSGQRDCAVFCQYLLDKRIDGSKLISHIISPSEIDTAYQGLVNQPQVYQTVVINWQNNG